MTTPLSRRQATKLLTALVICQSRTMTAFAVADNPKPVLYLIGDSTVKNGTKGLEGWGSELPAFFDTNKITVANYALGGRSSRTFLTEGHWADVAVKLKPGDFVLMQFGHNDGSSPEKSDRASLKGIGDETRDVANPKTAVVETVHTYGWYLRQFIRDAKAKGATPIVLSLVPRNDWKDGKVLRSETEGYGLMARQTADSEKVPFIDLNALIADRYDSLGQDKVKPLFPQEHTHTSAEGAKLNAECVAAGIRAQKSCPLALDLLDSPVKN